MKVRTNINKTLLHHILEIEQLRHTYYRHKNHLPQKMSNLSLQLFSAAPPYEAIFCELNPGLSICSVLVHLRCHLSTS